MENIEDQGKLIVNQLFEKLDLRALVKDPKLTLDQLIAQILVQVSNKTLKKTINESQRFVKNVSSKSEKASR